MPDPSPGAPALALFPYYEQLVPWFEEELAGITDEQLDFTNPAQWFAVWSIRRQVSHVCYAHFFWSGIQWGKVLRADDPVDIKAHLDRRYDRVLREDRWWAIADLKTKLRDCVGRSLALLRGETVAGAQAREVSMKIPAGTPVGLGDREDVHTFWQRYAAYHRRGIRRDADDPESWRFSLEMSMRHILWEGTTHLYAIQLIKKELGLATHVTLPAEGYVVNDMKKAAAGSQ
ncbi:MAG: hypothetical protein HYY96_09695 [Candidatus Tectomicrobia bacterium]|nr:hypothetical protein [Candidatus Tectomicrobia bacterium]